MSTEAMVLRIRRLIGEEAAYLIPSNSIAMTKLNPSRSSEGHVATIVNGRAAWAEPTVTEAEIDAEVAALEAADSVLQGNIDTEAGTRAAADSALDVRLDVLEAIDYATQAELDTHKTSTDHDGRYYTEAEVDAFIAGRASDAELTALQAEVDADEAALAAHIADTTDAHAGSAITNTPAGTIAATTVQAAINELDTDKATTGSVTTVQTNLDNHISDSSDAHAASAITASSTTLVGVATDVQGVLEELDNGIADHLADTSAAHAASAISADSTTLVGTGTDVQAVFEELDNAIASLVIKDGRTVTPIKTAAYNAVIGNLVRCDPSGGAFGVALPADHSAGDTIVVKNTTSSTNTITISTIDSDLIDTAASTTITTGFGCKTFVSDGSNWMFVT